MKGTIKFLCSALLLFGLAGFSDAQSYTGNPEPMLKINPGLGFEYFTKTIEEEGAGSATDLKTYMIHLRAGLIIREGFEVSAIVGYAFSDFNGMTFRNLPISVELQAGEMAGFIIGGEAKKSIFFMRDFGLDLFGQFVYYLGKKETWEVPGLSVEGSAEGKPSWMRGQVGPVISYFGINYLYPYIKICYNRLWGKFKMTQDIQELSGAEDKSFRGTNEYSAALGFIYEATDSLTIQTEALLMPRKNWKEWDYGISVSLVYGR
jgi:hypothetical protein